MKARSKPATHIADVLADHMPMLAIARETVAHVAEADPFSGRAAAARMEAFVAGLAAHLGEERTKLLRIPVCVGRAPTTAPALAAQLMRAAHEFRRVVIAHRRAEGANAALNITGSLLTAADTLASRARGGG